MVLNQECVRETLIFVASKLKMDENGKIEHEKVRNLNLPETLERYTKEDIYTALYYLVDKGLLEIDKDKSLPIKNWYISGVSSEGFDYLATIRDSAKWEKIKSVVGDIGKASIQQILAVGADIVLKSVLP